jgi:hypothetical protein
MKKIRNLWEAFDEWLHCSIGSLAFVWQFILFLLSFLGVNLSLFSFVALWYLTNLSVGSKVAWMPVLVICAALMIKIWWCLLNCITDDVCRETLDDDDWE